VPVSRLTLLVKPGCHLCDDARAVVSAVVDGMPDRASAPRVEELSILDDPDLAETYAEEIPVVLLDDRVHSVWRVDRDRLRAALLA